MKMRPRRAFIIIVAFQLLILLGLIGFNEATLAFGKTVVLQTAPVDPRDIFRGDYVILNYRISTLDSLPGYRTVRDGGKAYVRLEEGDDVWEATAISNRIENSWPVFIAGEVTSISGKRITMKYGIEAYFVPEGEGKEIERARDLKVRVSVDLSGKAVIKGLIVDGEPFQLR